MKLLLFIIPCYSAILAVHLNSQAGKKRKQKKIERFHRHIAAIQLALQTKTTNSEISNRPTII